MVAEGGGFVCGGGVPGGGGEAMLLMRVVEESGEGTEEKDRASGAISSVTAQTSAGLVLGANGLAAVTLPVSARVFASHSLCYVPTRRSA
jgi:hypothetical protein